MNVTLISIDLAKNIYQVCGVNQACKPQFNRPIKSDKLLPFLIKYHPGVTVAMEACGGSNYLGRTLQAHGFNVRIIPTRHVKPFVKGNKNDRNDAFAIAEAAMRPSMRFVSPKTVEQTDLSITHNIRERQVAARTNIVNQLRGLLREYGINMPQGIERVKEMLPFILEDAENTLTTAARRNFNLMMEEWRYLDDAIHQQEKIIREQARTSPAAELAMTIKGVGIITATAAVAHMGDPSQYKNGRQYAACLGLVPREYSSGGKQKLGGITKRGNRYLRKLLVQGAWSIIRHSKNADDRLSRWVEQVIIRSGKHKAAVALANKLARILWAVLAKQAPFELKGM
ncbi:IS110 family transposase [Alteromonas confluentis]|uniref:Transposase n=1 Tax=Alteromonas confluentis TaxID=1656094 RepID=A0A1E7Z8E5_9ALTE|nr:IS110 family transposase [Alteromonas confluentis]OFC69815.1 transposase [Alteromonas confluentis]OFC71160.1 transposase [Alteromonas confluentis]OFC71656.1 transposase [Alteromonas confluentis]OFC72411.1 transposase [Alteromonas confluentis]